MSASNGHFDDVRSRSDSLFCGESCGSQEESGCVEVEDNGSSFEVSHKCLGLQYGVDVNITNAVSVEGEHSPRNEKRLRSRS